MIAGPVAVITTLAAMVVCPLGVSMARAEQGDVGPPGRSIYTLGRSGDGRPLSAEVAAGVELPAGQYACVRCHRADGRGGLEGGVEIPNIRWSRLSGPVAAAGRSKPRPAYSAESLAKAIVFGVDSAGRALDVLMPRYDLDSGDLSDLISYLRVLGSEDAPGTSASSVRVGVLLPLSGPLAAASKNTLELLHSYFDDINRSGGIYGRRLELVTRDVAAGPAAAVEAARTLAEGDSPVFCFLSNAGAGAAGEVLTLLDDAKIPDVGPLSFSGSSSAELYVFRVLPTLFDQGAAAARYLFDTGSDSRLIALLRPRGAAAGSLLAGFNAEAARLDLLAAEQPWRVGDAESIVTRLKARGVEQVVLFGGADDLEAFVEEAQHQDWHPVLVVSSVLLERPIGVSLQRLIRVAPPLGLRPESNGAIELLSRFERLRRAGSENRANTAMAMAAFAGAEVLVEALKRSGRELNRDNLAAALAEMSGVVTGVLPAISFGPRRRRGVRGAVLVVSPAEGGRPESVWIDVSDSHYE